MTSRKVRENKNGVLIQIIGVYRSVHIADICLIFVHVIGMGY